MYKYPLIGTASDYTNPDNWHICPQEDNMKHNANVLYFIGTMAANPEGDDISTIDEPTLRQPFMGEFESSIFEPFCNIFFPWWRQVDTTALFRHTPEEVDQMQYAEPRTDVYAIMDHYFENYNQGKPFFLVGHSQGAKMIMIILEDYMKAHPEYKERMVAAYAVGVAVTKDYLKANPEIKMAKNADDTGVCLSWNTEGPSNDGFYGLVIKPDCVAINPINWKTDDTYASISENLGSVMPNSADGSLMELGGIADARVNVERGTIVVDSESCKDFTDTKAWGEEVSALFGPESYHGGDFGLFYYNIRDNAKLRLHNWIMSHS